jgi:hypothetical protein
MIIHGWAGLPNPWPPVTGVGMTKPRFERFRAQLRSVHARNRPELGEISRGSGVIRHGVSVSAGFWRRFPSTTPNRLTRLCHLAWVQSARDCASSSATRRGFCSRFCDRGPPPPPGTAADVPGPSIAIYLRNLSEAGGVRV